ncbi:MAG: type II toxin-antitoxin system prevent-host-death family antitoxin [Verrucomicrobia bacterium]|jgi:prevent-host-death family protein|nr:type II toxin-antitoxin system prevent-host-death family antitoxin [Verrucomicrobiota bacterium]NMD19000.1 type II toxin-antitoxin system prevent-host-death family antitoxin [Verrucomicrobiota bacterium]
MQTVSLTEAQEHLTELVRAIARKGELFITDANTPVAKLSPVTPTTSLRHLTRLPSAPFSGPFLPLTTTHSVKCAMRANDWRGHHLPGSTRTGRVARARHGA